MAQTFDLESFLQTEIFRAQRELRTAQEDAQMYGCTPEGTCDAGSSCDTLSYIAHRERLLGMLREEFRAVQNLSVS